MSFILISTLSLHDALPIFSFAVGLVTVTWFIMRQLKLKEPILEFRVLKYKMFAISTAIGMVTFVAMIGAAIILDRKSTRLNSSHVAISYAVFCLKKKKKQN